MMAIILAVALSLSSTNDYKYYTSFPTNADIRGIGMGPDGLYSFTRLEDASFLTESWLEREEALGLTNIIQSSGNVNSVPRPILFTGFNMSYVDLNGADEIMFLFPESFDSEYWYVKRGQRNSFVSPTFLLGSSRDGYNQCTDKWLIPGVIDDEYDNLSESYLGFIRGGYARLVPPNLVTNVGRKAGSMLSKSYVTALYKNLNHTGRIVSTESGIDGSGSTGWTKESYPKISLNNPTYTYGTYEFNGRKYQYATSYSLTPSSLPSQELYDEATPPLVYSHFTHISRMLTPYSTIKSRDSADPSEAEWTRGPVLNPYLWSIENHLYQSDRYSPLKVYSENITTGCYDKCSDIKAYLLLGYRRIVKKTHRYNNYSSSTNVLVSSSTNCCFASRELDITRSNGIIVRKQRPCVVFDTTFSMSDEIPKVVSYFGETSYEEYSDTPVSADASTIPASGKGYQSSLSHLSGETIVNRDIDLVWARVVFVFNRDYRAKIMDE